MAICVNEIAANIELNCDNPIVGGYTGRAVLIPMEANPIFTKSAANPRIIEGIAIDEGAKVAVVDNVGINPFDGSAITGNGDSGFTRFVKTVVLRIPERGADVAKNVIEPLAKSGRGFVGVFEKVDTNGDGSFEVIGAQNPLRCADPSTISRNETANGGAWSVTLQSTESYAEVDLLKTDYTTTLALFESLIAKGF